MEKADREHGIERLVWKLQVECVTNEEFFLRELFSGPKNIMLTQIDSGVRRIRKKWREDAGSTRKVQDLPFSPQELGFDHLLLPPKVRLDDPPNEVEDGWIIHDLLEYSFECHGAARIPHPLFRRRHALVV